MRDCVDGDLIRRWCARTTAAYALAQGDINALNVYPVPDGDTGTNLLLTAQSILDGQEDDLGDAASTMAAAARAALLGARGNSGVILSQILAGVSSVLAATTTDIDASVWAAALAAGADAGYRAVSQPVEGTVLTVARAAATAATEHARSGAALADVARRAAAEGWTALGRTREQLPVLTAAGVVDAGGAGVCLLLEAFCAVVADDEGVPALPDDVVAPVRGQDAGTVRALADAVRESGSAEFAFEVQYLLDAGVSGDLPHGLIATLETLGDCVLVVGGPDTWNVHAHVNDVGAAIEAGVARGRPRQITVARFADASHTSSIPLRVVAIVPGLPGGPLARLAETSGARVVSGGLGQAPSVGEIVSAIRAAGSGQVVVLPNDPDVHLAAVHAADIARGDMVAVTVLPTRSITQGLAALAVHQVDRAFTDDVVAMMGAAAATRSGSVTIAVRDADTPAGRCRAGDVLGLVDQNVVHVGGSLADAACQVIDRLLAAGGELVTVVATADAAGGAIDRIREHLALLPEDLALDVIVGDQHAYPIVVGVE